MIILKHQFVPGFLIHRYPILCVQRSAKQRQDDTAEKTTEHN